MSKKKGKKQQKPPSENPSPPPPEPQSTTPLSSPIKVLISSSKLNVPPPSPPKKQPEPPLHSEVQKSVTSFNENIRNNVDANGTLNLDGFLNGPPSTSETEQNQVIVIVPVKGTESEGRQDVVVQPISMFNELSKDVDNGEPKVAQESKQIPTNQGSPETLEGKAH